MYRDLQLKKGGGIFVREWNEDLEDFEDIMIEDEEMSFRLYDSICLDKNITLKDIFLMFSNHIEICSIVTGCPFLDEMIEEAFLPPGKDDGEMAALCLTWGPYIEKDENDNEVLMEFIKFYGMGNKAEYALEFTPINELIFYPIVINEEYLVKDAVDEELTYMKTRKRFTLMDLIRGIIDELSYMGPPDIKAFAFKELKNSDNEPMIEIFSQEEMESRFREKLESNKKPCVICGEESRSPSFGKPKNICFKCYTKIRKN